MRPRPNRRHFANDIIRLIFENKNDWISSRISHWGRDNMATIYQTTFSTEFFLNENVWILIKVSLKFVPKVPINNIPGFVQIMAWRRPGDKPLSEPMMVSLLTHICVTRPQWDNHLEYGMLMGHLAKCIQVIDDAMWVAFLCIYYFPKVCTRTCCTLFCCVDTFRSFLNQEGHLRVFYNEPSEYA